MWKNIIMVLTLYEVTGKYDGEQTAGGRDAQLWC
jgi:hypothetical protein